MLLWGKRNEVTRGSASPSGNMQFLLYLSSLWLLTPQSVLDKLGFENTVQIEVRCTERPRVDYVSVHDATPRFRQLLCSKWVQVCSLVIFKVKLKSLFTIYVWSTSFIFIEREYPLKYLGK